MHTPPSLHRPTSGRPHTAGRHGADVSDGFSVDVTSTLEAKVAALSAHRSQYALEPDLLPRSVLQRLLGTEHFAVATIPGR